MGRLEARGWWTSHGLMGSVVGPASGVCGGMEGVGSIWVSGLETTGRKQGWVCGGTTAAP